MRTLLWQLGSRSRLHLQDNFVNKVRSELLEDCGPGGALTETLVQWSAHDTRPLALLIDEIDALVGDTLISVLRQLRTGYDLRPSNSPQSVILCGVRDVQDYPVYSRKERAIIRGGSAFNIKAESLRLGDFSEGETRALLGQHTAQTGQAFEQGALDRVWELTRGQPWLVNALARQACFKDQAGRDRSRPINAHAIENAKETLILNRVTHIDQLVDKLRENRVRRVVEPPLAGTEGLAHSTHDLEYVRDLGLVARDPPVRIANPLSTEVVPRELTYVLQERLEQETAWYVDDAGNLDLVGLLVGFQQCFREHAEHWVNRFGYEEAGPQLVLQGFLRRVVNSGGRIEREYALGRGRTDLLILWPRGGSREPRRMRKHVIECKVLRDRQGLRGTIRAGLEQGSRYMDRCDAETGRPVIFDRRDGKSWDERVFGREERARGKPTAVWGR